LVGKKNLEEGGNQVRVNQKVKKRVNQKVKKRVNQGVMTEEGGVISLDNKINLLLFYKI
jgi:hypothetical protein